MKNWKTTALGILTIVTAVSGTAAAYLKTGAIPDLGVLIASVTAGFGLITAKDANVK